jgi:hypothetical protein
MKKRTLRFNTLQKLCAFAKLLTSGGFLINTITLTLTRELTLKEIDTAMSQFDAQLMLTTKKVFSYEL